MNVSRRLLSGLPFLLALVVLTFLGWSLQLSFRYPYDGIDHLSSTGSVQDLDPQGPANQVLEIEDTILLVDDVPLAEAQPFYPNKRTGDTATFVIRRGEENLTETLVLVQPPYQELVTRLAPLLLALIFWAIGVGVQAYQPASEGTNIFFLFFQASALFLIGGVHSIIGPTWANDLYNFIFWLLGPLTVHFHLYFPQKTSLPKQKHLLLGLYTIIMLAGWPYFVFGVSALKSSIWYASFLFASRIFLLLNMLLAIGLLFYTYRHATTAGVRSKIRIVVLGGALSLLPVISLFLLPYTLLAQSIIPFGFMFIFLGVMPLTYGYAIFRHRLIEIERHVNRGATVILVYSILGGFYLVLYALLTQYFPPGISYAVINTIIVLLLASIFVPLRRNIQRIVDSAFYGGWYDYRSAVSLITQGIDQITDLRSLAVAASERLVKTLRLEEACVFLADMTGDYSIVEISPSQVDRDGNVNSFAPLPRSSLSYLLNMGEAVERDALRNALTGITLSPEEHQLLNSEQVHLWVPIIGHEHVLGLLALGPKFGGDIFSAEDIDILRIVARQMGPVIENIHLVSRLRRYAADLEKRVADRTEELAASKKRVEAILSSVGEGVIVTDLKGRFLNVNDAFKSQTGYSEAELIGQRMWKFYRIEDAAAKGEELREALKEAKVWKNELRGIHKDGSYYDVQLTVTPLLDENGSIVSYVGSQRDITQQKELDRLKDLFVSDVSHELRTPTTNIGLYVELLETALPEKHPAYLQVLKEQSHLLVKLVEDILDLSRLAIGKARRIEFTDVNMNKLVEQVVIAHRPLAEASGLYLTYDVNADLPLVRGEPNQLARLINNLVSNAIHYTSEGGVHVRTFRSDGCICLEVQDTGMGIDAEDKPHLFERFYRGKRVRQSKIHGTGLGLAIVKEIVDLHESIIDIKSEIGKGSTFTIRFPIFMNDPWPEKQY
ncbi:MAG TPA: ATP-binding protein [Anaerolineales bacterium]|nr:ATP-binding protein [Anaerolineales bacterium]